MRTKLLLVILCAICSIDSYADEVGTEAAMDEKFKKAVRNIPSVIKRYANTIGCNVNLDNNSVVQYDFDGMKSYIAVVHTDSGCSGGSAMSRPVFIVLKRRPMKKS